MAGKGRGEAIRRREEYLASARTSSRRGTQPSAVSTVQTVPTATTSTALTDWEQNVLPTLPNELQEAYAMGGVEGFNEAVDAYNKRISLQSPQGISVVSGIPYVEPGSLNKEITEVSGVVDESKMYAGGVAGKASADAGLVELVDKGGTASEILNYLVDNPEAARGSYAAGVLSQLGDQTAIASNLTDRDQFDAYVAMGYIPEGSEYVAPITQEDINRWQAESVGGSIEDIEALSQLEPRGWGYITPEMQEAAREAARERYVSVVEPYLTQVRGYRAAQDKRVAAQTDLKDYVNDDGSLRLYEAAQAGVPLETIQLAGYDVSQSDYNMAKADIVSISAEPDPLEPYAIMPPLVARDQTPEGYDIARYLRDNNDDDSVLLMRGFSDTDIEEARKYNRENPWAYATDIEKFQQAVIDAGGSFIFDDDTYRPENQGGAWVPSYTYMSHPDMFPEGINEKVDKFWESHPELKSLRDTVYKPSAGPYPKVDLSLEGWVANWLSARGIEKVAKGEPGWLEYKLASDAAIDAYTRKYGPAATARSTGTQALTFVFAPARVMYPEIEFKDITAKEWAVGVAQVALIGAPILSAPFRLASAGLGKAVGLSLQALAGGTFATVTAMSWNDMSPGERALAVALDTLVIGSVLHSAGVLSMAGRATRSTINKARQIVAQVFERSGVSVTATREADEAIQQILRGIETGNAEMIKAGEARLRAAMADKSVPVRIQRMVSDGGSYISGHATDYQRLIETTRNMNYAENLRLRGGQLSNTRVSNQALRRMVTLADDELAAAQATQASRLAQLRRAYIEEIAQVFERERINTLRWQRSLDKLYGQIEAELRNLRKFGMTQTEEAELLRRLDIERLQQLAQEAIKVRRAGQLHKLFDSIEQELARYRQYGITSSEETNFLKRLYEDISTQEVNRIRRIAQRRSFDKLIDAIESDLKQLRQSGMTSSEQARIMEQLNRDFRAATQRQLARLRELRDALNKEAEIEARLADMRARGYSTSQIAAQRQQFNGLMRELDRIITKRRALQAEVARLEELMADADKTVTGTTEAQSTIDDIEKYLREGPEEPPLPTEPTTEGGGAPTRTRVKTRPRTKPKAKTPSQVSQTRATETPVATNRPFRLSPKTEEIIRIVGEPMTWAVAASGLAEAGLPVGSTTAVPLPIPEATPYPIPYTLPYRAPSISPTRTPSPRVTPEEGVMAQLRPAPAESPQPEGRPVPKPEPQPTPSPAPSPVPSPQPQPEPSPQPVPQPEPEPRPSSPPPIPTKTKPKPFYLPSKTGYKERRVPIPPGAIAFKYGWTWRYIPPDDFGTARKPQSLPRGVVPMGADTSGGNSPYTTIQVIGKSKSPVPEMIAVDIGIADVFVTDYGRKISFAGKGQKTDVGERIPSTTQGMSVGRAGTNRPEMGTVYPKHSISRTAMSKELPSRKAKKPKKEKTTSRYFDEDEEWMESLEPLSNKKTKSKNRTTMSKSKPRRKARRDESLDAQLRRMSI